MLDDSPRINSPDDLKFYVHQTLCHHNELEINAFAMTQRILVRGGRPCGIYFCLHGPRAVKLTAIWETDSNSVLFYSATGQRMSRSRLAQAPELALQPA